MSALSEGRQRLIERRRGMEVESPPDRTSARERLHRAAHNIDAQFSPANLLGSQLEHHPYLTLAVAVGAGVATGVLSHRLKTVSIKVVTSGLLPIASKMAISWLLRQR